MGPKSQMKKYCLSKTRKETIRKCKMSVIIDYAKHSDWVECQVIGVARFRLCQLGQESQAVGVLVAGDLEIGPNS